MKVNPKFLIMMAALVAGTASALPGAPTATSAGTAAGTVITNTATASYADPTGVSATPLTSTSNIVSTTVTPITGFDITYSDGSADGTTATTPATSYDIPNVKPDGRVFTTYTVLNNSNINGYVVNVAPDTTGSAAALSVANVKYYPAGTTAANLGDATHGELTSVTLNNGAQVNIVQVITIPTAATPDQKYSASPKGTAPASSDTTAYPTAPTAVSFAQYLEATNNTTTGDLEYTRATVNKPVLTIIDPPTVPGSPTPPSVPTTGTPSYPPSGVTPPTVTYIPPTTPTYTTPPITPVTPNNPGTVVVLNGDNQQAYSKADTNTAADVVTFVSNVQNDGPVNDTIYVKPPALPAGATSVQLLDKDGNALVVGTGANAGRYLIPGTVAPGGSAQYQVVVTYPDSDSKDPQASIVTPVEIFSGNVPTAPAKASTFTIYPPQMRFGDTDGAVSNASLVITETVDPSGTTNTTAVAGDRSAVFPMTIENTGTYNEAFTLSGTVDIVDRNGNTIAVPVTYYTALGAVLATTGETPVIAAGGTYSVLAVVNVPANAAATTTGNEALVTQTATGKFSGDSASDAGVDRDKIKVAATGKVGVAKFVKKTGAAAETVTTPAPSNVDILGPAGYTATTATTADPKTDITYRIIAKNTYNSPVASFFISDAVPANTTYKSVALNTTLTGSAITIYKVGNGSWSATMPAAGEVAGTLIQIAVDADGVAPYLPAPLATDKELSAEFVVTVK